MITDTQFFPSFFLAFPSLFLPRLPLAGDSKKVDVKSNSCSGCWQQQFGDLHRAGRVNKIHLFFGFSQLILFRFVFFPCLRKAAEQPRLGSFGKSSLDRAVPSFCAQCEKGLLQAWGFSCALVVSRSLFFIFGADLEQHPEAGDGTEQCW